MFYWQKIACLFQVQEKLRTCWNLKISFSNSRFIAGDSDVNVISSHTAVFNENVVLCFSDNEQLLIHSFVQIKQAGMQISKFSFALDKWNNWFKFWVNCRSEIIMYYFIIKLQLTWFSKRMLLSIDIIGLKIA